ncbi:MAG: NUDIX hydrolase [Desulfobulbaceae bacterium]|nr:MAG: NUDIX hydrolase [Desulfobulbaceae bacterium]
MDCQNCGQPLKYRNPVPTVDIIIRHQGGIILIKRRNPPYGWALPGGFVDYGESLEEAAIREAREETGLHITNLKQFHTYSDPERDSRLHTITTVYTATADGTLQAGDDAAQAALFWPDNLPSLAFDHDRILADYLARHAHRPQNKVAPKP